MHAIIAMLIGIAGTSVIHTSKGVMKLGLQRLQVARATNAPQRGASVVYGLGMLANFTTPFWVMLANLFAPTVFYTSMYGLGLVALLVFSRIVLREQLTRRHILGTGVIIAGTGFLGAGELLGAAPMLTSAELTPLVVITVLWVTGGLAGALVTGSRRIGFQEIFFGLAAGGMASLDALLKGIAQQGSGGATLIPGTALGGVVLAGSFVVAAGAFGMIQWSYVRYCRASVMGTAYDLSYVGLPVLLFALLKPDYGLTLFNTLGLVTLAAGALIVQKATAVPTMHEQDREQPAVFTGSITGSEAEACPRVAD